MKLDFSAHLGAVDRRVTDGVHEGTPVRRVTLGRSYDTTPGDLWDALTDPDRLRRWFLPVSGELWPGGRYQIEGNAGGTIRECDSPRRLALTWEFGGGVSWVEVDITAEGGTRARLELSHVCPVDDFWREYGPGAVGVGWDLGLLGLALHLSGAGKLDEDALAASPDGRAFIAGCSSDWRRAAVECGEDPDHAAEAARRSTAFYAGEAPGG